jgi:hypothetical protein
MGPSGKHLQPKTLLCLALTAWCAHAHAVGLGNLALHSSLGAPLHASVRVNGADTDGAANLCLRSRLESLDGRLLSLPQATLSRKDGGTEIQIRSRENIEEPAATLSIEAGCGATVRREFAILLDPAPQPVSPPEAAPRAAASQEHAGGKGKADRKSSTMPRAPGPAATTSRQAHAAASVLRLSAAAETAMPATPALEAPHLRFSDTLSDPRSDADPARKEALRADQARVAALLRGEDPYRAAESRTRDAQRNEQAMRREALLARQQSAADRKALDEERQRAVKGPWIGALGAALLMLVAGFAWLRWRDGKSKRAAEHSFFSDFDAIADEASVQAPPSRPAAVEAQPAPAFPKAAAPAIAALPPSPPAEKPGDPSAFGFAWHESGETVMPPTQAQAEIHESANSLDWLDALGAEEPAVPAAEEEEAAARVADLLLAAEAWMADYNPLRAIALLEPACAQERQASPAPMLYLLELYRIVGDEEKCRALEERCAAQFPLAGNGGKAAWPTDGFQQNLSDFPEILADVENLRGAGLQTYLQGLLLRQDGFAFPVYRDIMRRLAEAVESRQERDIADFSLDFHHG